MKRQYDCFDMHGRYLGVFFASDVTALVNSNSRVYYIAGDKARRSNKHWSCYDIEDLDRVRYGNTVHIIEPEMDTSLSDVIEMIVDRNISADSTEFKEEMSNYIKSTIKAKEEEKSLLLARVKELREEIKELQEQLSS